uniref:Tr-type G domain-containing protein n=1 Tax=Clastoptera arizonana TaxID=38151 RepID=A0A1B6D8W3_9HEMI
MIELIIEDSEILLNKYLEKKKITIKEINKELRKKTIEGKMIPLLCGSAFKNKGIQPLLDAIIEYLPSPLDIKYIKGLNENNKIIKRKINVNESFSALAFKIMNDSFVGQLIFFRVYSGNIKTGDIIYNSLKKKKEKLGRILQMHANQRKEIKEVKAGDIAAAIGLKDINTGDTLCDFKNPIILEKIKFPETVISQSIEVSSKSEQEKLNIALNKLIQEDPSFNIKFDNESGQTIISGMGELHLEIIIDRIKREYNIDVKIGQPQVAYRETISKICNKVEGKFIKQSGGRGQYGHVVLKLKPLKKGKGFKFVNSIKGGAIPKEFISSIEKGILESSNTGVLLGYKVVDIKVILIYGSYHEVDSSENAFKIAASIAFKKGCLLSKPKILEPIMYMEIETPEIYAGNVIAEISSRRGIILDMQEISNNLGKLIKVKIPLSETFGYSTSLRSITQGRASYTMNFLEYSKLPKNILEKIIKIK